MLSRTFVLPLVSMVFSTLATSCAFDMGDKRLSLTLDDKHARHAGVPVLVSGPTFLGGEPGPSVDSDGDGARDTYGPSDIVKIAVGYSEQVCGFGVLKLALRTGSGPEVTRNAKYCGCGPESVSFCYRVRRGDRDRDGLAIPPNAITLRTYGGIVTDSRHRPTPSQPGHRVDGSLPDITRPVLRSAPGVSGKPSYGNVYRRGEKIQITAHFTERVKVDTSGGLPTLGLQVGRSLRRAVYVGDGPNGDRHGMSFMEDSHRVHFEYEVRKGDRDRDGTVWVPANGLEIPPGSSIRDLAGNDASVGWSVSSGRNVSIDGG